MRYILLIIVFVSCNKVTTDIPEFKGTLTNPKEISYEILSSESPKSNAKKKSIIKISDGEYNYCIKGITRNGNIQFIEQGSDGDVVINLFEGGKRIEEYILLKSELPIKRVFYQLLTVSSEGG